MSFYEIAQKANDTPFQAVTTALLLPSKIVFTLTKEYLERGKIKSKG